MKPLWKQAPEVELADITTILGDSVVLHRLGLHIPAGKVTVLMGPSGAGKTTLIKHIVGLLEPNAGTVRIDGRDVWAASEQEWRDIRGGMGAMLGGHTLYSTSLFSSMTALDNLIYSQRNSEISEAERVARARDRLRELNLADAADQLPEKLPAHATRRLALARALVADAPLTVLDEIDLGLDAQHRRLVLAAVRNLYERTRCTLLVTTHTLELARSLADNLAILVNGRIVATGPPEELLDGVETAEDFDRRFEYFDFLGPPQLEDAKAVVDQKTPERSYFEFTVDPKLVWLAVFALVAITALFLSLKVFSGGSPSLP